MAARKSGTRRMLLLGLGVVLLFTALHFLTRKQATDDVPCNPFDLRPPCHHICRDAGCSDAHSLCIQDVAALLFISCPMDRTGCRVSLTPTVTGEVSRISRDLFVDLCQEKALPSPRIGAPTPLFHNTESKPQSSMPSATPTRSPAVNVTEVKWMSAECLAACPTAYNVARGGYPAVAMHTSELQPDLAQLICPSTFRDTADYVVNWPHDHFRERVNIVGEQMALKCLPPTPIIYVKADHQHVTHFKNNIAPHLRDFIVITGQSDASNPQAHRDLLDSPKLVRWFGQNPDLRHPKFEAVPLGLNCFEHGPEMVMAHRDMKSNNRMFPSAKNGTGKYPTNLALVNFGDTNPARAPLRRRLCSDGPDKFTECINKGIQNNILSPNRHLLELYSTNPGHLYWVAPEGNGVDTHRLWEALYVGAVPIAKTSMCDELYADLPIMILQSWDELTGDRLMAKLPEYRRRENFNMAKMYRQFWWQKFEATRTAHLLKTAPETLNYERHRCWDPR